MQSLFVDGPNIGTFVNFEKEGLRNLVVLDPSERLSYAVDNLVDLDPVLKVNYYYGVPAHPYAKEHGIDMLFYFSRSNK